MFRLFCGPRRQTGAPARTENYISNQRNHSAQHQTASPSSPAAAQTTRSIEQILGHIWSAVMLGWSESRRLRPLCTELFGAPRWICIKTDTDNNGAAFFLRVKSLQHLSLFTVKFSLPYTFTGNLLQHINEDSYDK